jgi:hypothetical protein
MNTSDDTLYFAYGSNLSSKDRENHCKTKSIKDFLGSPIYHAELRNYKLIFNKFSSKRKGGVLSIIQDTKHSVKGILFTVTDLETLNKKEGVGKGSPSYKMIKVKVIVNEIEKDAFTYIVIPAENKFHLPSDDYLKICREGRNEHGICIDQLEKAAKNQ